MIFASYLNQLGNLCCFDKVWKLVDAIAIVSLSKIMTILIAFDPDRDRNFEHQPAKEAFFWFRTEFSSICSTRTQVKIREISVFEVILKLDFPKGKFDYDSPSRQPNFSR